MSYNVHDVLRWDETRQTCLTQLPAWRGSAHWRHVGDQCLYGRRYEEEEELATIINGDAPTAIARACAEMQIPLVHISTDYVFEGLGEVPWKPNDTTAPQNAYGRSKLAGETGILGSAATHVILRTSWVVSAHGANFIKTMLHLSKARDTLSVVADQIGSRHY